MNAGTIFNKEIGKLITEDVNSKFSKTVLKITKGSFVNFYCEIDKFTDNMLGFHIGTKEVEVDINYSKYLPVFFFNKENVFNEKKGIKFLEKGERNLDECYRYLANQVVYKMMDLPDLDKFIEIYHNKYK